MIRALFPYRYPSSLIAVLGEEKNGEERFWKRNLVKFFSFLREGGGEEVSFVFLPCFQCVLIMFPEDSQVPNVFPNPFPKILPIAPDIYPI
jgi:hypothetical protein